jgi:3'-phosphoadenosine 5'-phosphosulfate (PAPS) 3'-phosphatase
MNTDNVWTALAVFGNARISNDEIYATALDWNAAAEVAQRWIRNQLNSEANLEGVSLRINTLADGRLDIYLRKFS